MSTLELSDGEIHYTSHGEGPLVFLLHGGGLDGRMWDQQVPVLADSYRVVVPDARGHGQSSTPLAPFRHSDDVAALVRHLDAGPAVLVGLSMGAGAAVDTTLEHPDLVKGVVISGAGTSEPEFHDPWVLEILDTWRRTQAAGDAEGWIDAFMLFAAGPQRRLEDLDQTIVGNLRQMVTHTVSTHVVPGAAAPEPVPDSWNRLVEISVPVTAISGALDPSDQRNMAARVTKTVAEGHTVLIDDAAHYPNMEQPDAFNSEVQAFLEHLHSAAHSQNLSSAEREILALLSMCPETTEQLEDMFVQDDLREFRRGQRTVRQGLTAALHKLADLRLVASKPQNQNASANGDKTTWQLTKDGIEAAKRINKQA